MLASYKWLKELCAFEASPDEVRKRFTESGLEVESVKEYGNLPGVVIAEVRGKKPHPNKDKLSLVTLFDGERELEVVCGAPNVPAAGKRVLFARLGAKLPNGMEIAERKLAGVISQGMICSEVELDIGSEGDGIFVVDDDVTAAPGTLVSEALGLHDFVFEIGLTPNRPDCLGHVGLSRELSALLSVQLRLPKIVEPKKLSRVPELPKQTKPVTLFTGAPTEPAIANVPIVVADSVRCPRYATCVVDQVKVQSSPFWLRYRLHVLGLRAISNVVDITNLVLLGGDMNDTPDSTELTPLWHDGFKDVQSHPSYPTDRPGTFDTGTARNKIDYLIMSPVLHGHLEEAGIERRGSYHPNTWVPFDTVRSKADEASDHHLVWADFEL